MCNRKREYVFFQIWLCVTFKNSLYTSKREEKKYKNGTVTWLFIFQLQELAMRSFCTKSSC
jgi:hypothetical protein